MIFVVGCHEAKGLLFEVKSRTNTIYWFGFIYMPKAHLSNLAIAREGVYVGGYAGGGNRCD
ncbi:hypothetical protein EJG51_011705 [Undibacterium piscinae]|jgi:hypothetical protein|uniref:Uncharacterized protein n=1 Tax=Undibacterium piscinae TaxID=2495591 RepID=A0A6M4A5I8_9BURK|nr:hypothetical protein EJG51_011705 [Undibacterium piscinae]